MNSDLSGYKKQYQDLVEDCSAHQALHKFKVTVSKIGGMIDPLDFTSGLIVHVTGSGKNQIKKIQTSAQEYANSTKSFSKSKLCQQCTNLFGAIRDKKATRDIIMNELGTTVVFNFNTHNQKIIHSLGSCDWCVCGSDSTATRCSKECCS